MQAHDAGASSTTRGPHDACTSLTDGPVNWALNRELNKPLSQLDLLWNATVTASRPRGTRGPWSRCQLSQASSAHDGTSAWPLSDQRLRPSPSGGMVSRPGT